MRYFKVHDHADPAMGREYLRGLIAGEGLTEDELKRLDKTTTVMKVAINIVVVLSARGVGGRFNPSEKVDA